MTIVEEQKVISRIINGDRNAYEVLVLANQKKVYNLALRITRDWSEALDISQEAFLKAFQRLGEFRGDSRFSVWLYRLTYNVCVDFVRKRKRSNTTWSIYWNDNDNPTDIDFPDLRNLPEERIFQKELQTAINDCIAELSPIHSDIIYLREVSGMSYREIALTLKVSEGTVKSRLVRARNNLLNIISERRTLCCEHTLFI